MRKDPGSSAWHFVKAITDAELKQAHEKYLADMVARHGDEPRDVLIELNDSADVAQLRSLGIAPPQEVPGTLAVRLLYRQLPELRSSGLLYWGKGSPRPIRTPGLRESLPEKAAEAFRSTGPQGQFSPTALPAAVDGTNSTQTVTIWTEGFESNQVPGTYWTAGDFNSTTGSDYWGDISTSCSAQVHGGSWSIGCNGYGSYPSCVQYVNDQDAYAQNASYLNLSGYSTYDASFYVKYQTQAGYDYFWWAYSIGGGWIQVGGTYSGTGGWSQLGVTISNASHTADNFAFQFNFYSDYINTGVGVYVDDLLVRGDPFLPNLAAYTPSGWSGPIVPSSVTSTWTTGTLYAGQPTYIDWAVQNNGAASAGGFNVYYYLDNNYIGSNVVPSLVNGSFWYQPDWSYTVATAGTHTLKMTIDPTGTVAESNEGDNTYQAIFYWNPAQPPDLIVQSIVPTATTLTIGSTMNAAVTIKNQGPGYASGTFYTYFYKNLGSMPTLGRLPYDDTRTTFSLAPGATDSYTIYNLSSAYAGSWNMYAYVDATNAITNESNEGNNGFGSVTITWNAGTSTISGTLTYDDASYSGATNVQNRPVRLATVELWRDLGGSGDTKLATSSTDASGHYAFSAVPNSGGLNVYVLAYCQSDAGRTAADVGIINSSFATYTVRTTTFSSVPVGTWTAPTYKPSDYTSRSALHIYDAMLNGYTWATGQGGSALHPYGLRVQWQPGVNYSTFYVGYDPNTGKQALQLCGAYSPANYVYGPDEWDDSVLLHEYGHHLQYLFNFSGNVGGPHSPISAETEAFAFSEGSAHFLCAAMLSSSWRRNVGVNSSFYETHVLESDLNTGWVGQDSTLSWYVGNQGATYEIAVAGFMWDVIDGANDTPNGCADILTEPVGHTWVVLTSHDGPGPTTVGDFARWYCQRYGYGNATLAAGLTSTLCKHGIPMTGCGTTAVEGDTRAGRGWISVAPNPLRGSGQFLFEVPSGLAAEGTLSLYDVVGRRIAVIGKGTFEPGVHGVSVQGALSGIRPGMYLCRLEIAGAHFDTRLLVVR